jgi:hypothetical protein
MTKQSKKVALFTLSFEVNGRQISATLTADQIARLVNVSKKTARRWIDGTQHPHPHTLELLRMKVFGAIPGSAWSGYYVTDNGLHTPSGGCVEPRDVDALVWLRGIYYQGVRDNERKKEELDGLIKLLPTADLRRIRR